MNQADITTKHYAKRFGKHKYTSQLLSWKSIGASHQRFRVMWKEIDFNNKSVLDVGCGFGEMAKWLYKRYENVEYVGVDIVESFIKRARVKHPHYEFKTRDYFKDPLEKNFDIVMASGTINSDLGSKEKNMEFRKHAIKTMFDHTKKVLVFNMLGAHPAPEAKKGSNIWYADSLEILDYCMSLTRRVVLRADYHKKDFTILMYPTKK